MIRHESERNMNTEPKTLQVGTRREERVPKQPRQIESGRSISRIRDVLVPTDFSERANTALRYAIAFAEQFGARITLLHILSPPASYPDAPSLSAESFVFFLRDAERSLDHVCECEQLKRPLLRQTIISEGVTWDAIVETAKAQKTDLIILATHGRSGLARVLIGSTAEQVIRHAPCPVLVVPVRKSDLRHEQNGTNHRP
jgi:universal stress protein A